MELKPVIQEGFSIKPSLLASAIKIELRGSADMEARSILSQYIDQVDAETKRLHMAEVIVDVHELYFINSVCLKSLVTWLDRIVNMPAIRRYYVTFLVDPKLRWQDRSILALQRMAPDVVRITNWKAD